MELTQINARIVHEYKFTGTLSEYIIVQIKAKRVLKGISTKEMAEKLGMKSPSYTYIERGKHSITTDMLYKICSILECSSQDLLPF